MNYLTTKDVAKRVHVTEYTVRKYIREGKLKATKVHKHYLIPEPEIEVLLQAITFNKQPA